MVLFYCNSTVMNLINMSFIVLQWFVSRNRLYTIWMTCFRVRLSVASIPEQFRSIRNSRYSMNSLNSLLISRIIFTSKSCFLNTSCTEQTSLNGSILRILTNDLTVFINSSVTRTVCNSGILRPLL